MLIFESKLLFTEKHKTGSPGLGGGGAAHGAPAPRRIKKKKKKKSIKQNHTVIKTYSKYVCEKYMLQSNLHYSAEFLTS